MPAETLAVDHPADAINRVRLALGSIADLIASAKDLHIVDPDGLSVLLRSLALDLEQQEHHLSR